MTEILFVGTTLGIESRAEPAAGFPLETIPVRGLKGRGLTGLAQGMVGIPASFFRSLGILRRFRPDCVVGVGGYASGPLLLAARFKGIRSAVMEQNLRPGLTNRVLGKLVDRVFTAYEASASWFPRPAATATGALDAASVEKTKTTLPIFAAARGAPRQSMRGRNAKKPPGMEKELRVAPGAATRMGQDGVPRAAVRGGNFRSSRWTKPTRAPSSLPATIAKQRAGKPAILVLIRTPRTTPRLTPKR
jgi:hypothetical protein